MPPATTPSPPPCGLSTSPPGPIYLTTLAATALLTVGATSAPGGYLILLLLVMLLWLALAAIGGIWSLLAVAQRAGRASLRRRWRQWLAAPLITTAVLASVVHQIPLRMRLALSEPALRAAAETMHRNGRLEPGRYGLFMITSIGYLPGGGATFEIPNTGFLGTGHLIYNPGGLTLHFGHSAPLGGPWSSWVNSWD